MKINILGIPYKIILQNHGPLGLTTPASQTQNGIGIIAINISLVESEMEFHQTLFHEIGHVLFNDTGLHQVTPPKLEEIIVDLYSQHFPRIINQLKINFKSQVD